MRHATCARVCVAMHLSFETFQRNIRDLKIKAKKHPSPSAFSSHHAVSAKAPAPCGIVPQSAAPRNNAASAACREGRQRAALGGRVPRSAAACRAGRQSAALGGRVPRWAAGCRDGRQRAAAGGSVPRLTATRREGRQRAATGGNVPQWAAAKRRDARQDARQHAARGHAALCAQNAAKGATTRRQAAAAKCRTPEVRRAAASRNEAPPRGAQMRQAPQS